MSRQQESKTKPDMSPLIKQYGELLSKCIGRDSLSESNDARYSLNQMDQQLRIMGLHATIKIGIEKIE